MQLSSSTARDSTSRRLTTHPSTERGRSSSITLPSPHFHHTFTTTSLQLNHTFITPSPRLRHFTNFTTPSPHFHHTFTTPSPHLHHTFTTISPHLHHSTTLPHHHFTTPHHHSAPPHITTIPTSIRKNAPGESRPRESKAGPDPHTDDPFHAQLLEQIRTADELLDEKARTEMQLEQKLLAQTNQTERAEARCGHR
jgi:hypothetical protein